jgi:hypothetical protein
MFEPLLILSLTGLILVRSRVLVTFTGHVRPCLNFPVAKSQLDLSGSCSGFQKVELDMSGPQSRHVDSSAKTRVKARHRTCPVSRPGFREGCQTCPTLSLDMSGSLTPPMGRIPGGGGAIKGSPRP